MSTDKKNRATNIMFVRLYEPTEKFIEYLKKHGEEFPKKDTREFTRTYDVYSLIGFPYFDDLCVYFKDTKEFVNLDEVVDHANTNYSDITVDNIIIFGYEASFFINEEISNIGLEEFIEDIILEWEEYFKKHLKKLDFDLIRAASTEELRSIGLHTAWHSWSEYDSWNGDYDSGIDYVGIIDMHDLNIIKIECDCGFKHLNGQCFYNCPAPGKIK